MKPKFHFLAHRPAVCHDRPTTVQLLVKLQAPVAKRRLRRSPLNLGLCLDRSGSMAGAPIEHARLSAIHVVEQMKGADQISAVAFDNEVEVVIPFQQATRPGPLRIALKHLEVGGSTDLHQGWVEACHQVERGLEKGRLSRVVILSDGQTNCGLCETDAIVHQVRDWQARGVTTSTVGLGASYNEDLLVAMAEAGHGNFYHVEQADQIEPFFQIPRWSAASLWQPSDSTTWTPRRARPRRWKRIFACRWWLTAS